MSKHKKEKFLTLILRHQPEVAGIVLDAQGWTNVQALVKAVKKKYPDFDESTLRMMVDTSEKKRFEYSNETRVAIRACQGHSVKIDLGLPQKTPPEWLYHGTTWSKVGQIETQGIKSMSRTHVQLSEDEATAYSVGLRHGSDVCILHVMAKTMHDKGFKFKQSTNGVWLIDDVPGLYFFPKHPSFDLRSPYRDA